MYPEISVLSFVFAALTLVPLIWYLRARNIAAVAIGIWLSITNLTFAVDALVWAESTDIKVAGWCDISTALITGSYIALPAACLSICIHLERLASFCQMSTSQVKPRRIIFECLMCFGLPVVYILLHLIVQPRRFDLFYGFGCRPATYPAVTTIFLVMIPPLLLTGGTIACASLAWRHFLVHGVQFYGKKGSISSPTRNLYLRLIGMALLEAVLSAVSIVIIMWSIFSPGLASMGNMSRDLNNVLVWGPETTTNHMRTVLTIEWSVTVAQSIVFFGLFACRMEVFVQGRELIHSFLRSLKRPNSSVIWRQDILEHSSMSTSVPTLPSTIVDLSLIMPSYSTLTPCDHLTDKYLPSIPGTSRPPSPDMDGSAEDEVMVSAMGDSAMGPLESPSRASAIASSHNSFAPDMDPSRHVFSLDAWPRTPTTIPIRFSRRSSCTALAHDTSWPTTYEMYMRSSCSTADFWTRLSGCREKRQGICVMVVKETVYC